MRSNQPDLGRFDVQSPIRGNVPNKAQMSSMVAILPYAFGRSEPISHESYHNAGSYAWICPLFSSYWYNSRFQGHQLHSTCPMNVSLASWPSSRSPYSLGVYSAFWDEHNSWRHEAALASPRWPPISGSSRQLQAAKKALSTIRKREKSWNRLWIRIILYYYAKISDTKISFQ